MIHTPRQALEFVRRHGIVTMTRGASKRSLVEAIAGGPVRGSWWGHPKGKLIFRLAESLHDSREVVSLKLVDGKVTFLHRSLWPALARVVTDPEWRRSKTRGLPPRVGELLRVVERRGTLRLDQASLPGRKELERSLLVHSGSMHTEKGSHAAVLTSWRKVFDSETLVRARRLSLSESLSLLGLA
ncbi:MAG TPA: RNA methyltransferase [Planctomycetota bacterium]|jgi:hypothetical protein